MDDPIEDIETPPDYDPLLDQASRLPDFIKGSDGNAGQHVKDAGDGEGVVEESLDDGMGYVPPDPSKFTGD